MNIRRERLHQTGTSNLANSPSKKNPPLASAFPSASVDFGNTTLSSPSKSMIASPSKATTVYDVIWKKARSGVSPLDETREFYETAKKDQKIKVKLASTKSAHLEESDKRKICFTGESHILYDKNLDKYCGDSPEKGEIDDRKRKPKTYKSKLSINAQAEQETQLVGMDNNDTVKNNVNLEKVREARRALRRRYANRTNLQKIFAAWDEENTGVISVDNIHSMAKKLGLNLNRDEARVLLASADNNASGSLGLDEFLDLIYNKDDALNVDINRISKSFGDKHTVGKHELDNETDGLLRKLEEDAKKGRDAKYMNQIRFILKNRVHDLGHAMNEIDRDRSGYVNLFKFEQALQKLQISEAILPQAAVTQLFDKFKTDHTKLNYKDFLKDLKEFKFQYDQVYNDYESSPDLKERTTAPFHSQTPGDKLGNDGFATVDCRDLPFNQIVNFHTKSKKVGRAIQRFLPSKEDLNEYISKHLKIGQDEVEKKYVSSNEFKGIVEDMFKKFDVRGNVSKHDIQGFLSSLIYNKQGCTTFKDVAHTIYEETEKQFFDKIQRRMKGPVPQADVLTSGEAQSPFLQTMETESMVLSPTKTRVHADEEELWKKSRVKSETRTFLTKDSGAMSPSKLALDGEKSATFSVDSRSPLPSIRSPGRPFRKTMIGTMSLSGTQRLEPVLGGILKKIDDKLFVGTKTQFKTFKEFDVDGDGFVSHQDFVAKLESKKILKKEEIPRLLEYLDPQRRGFVDFNEFSSKIRPNMANDDETGETRQAKAKSSLYFTKPDFNKAYHSAVWSRKSMYDIKRGMEPESTYDYDGLRATRYGAHPNWPNTFQTFQGNSHTALFVSEDERFYRHRLAGTRFQMEEKAKKDAITEFKLETKRQNEARIQERVERETIAAESRDNANLMRHSDALHNYTLQAKLRNGHVFT